MSRDSAPRGQHGYANTEPEMQASFVASGAHIQAGVKLGVISNLSTAPTVQGFLALSLPDAEGSPVMKI